MPKRRISVLVRQLERPISDPSPPTKPGAERDENFYDEAQPAEVQNHLANA